jgi:formylglycine-generating enzyme required for sulfatase activity
MEEFWVEAGTFTMGSPTTEAGRQADRETEHNVSLTQGFYLGKYEVTQAQYQGVMTGNTDAFYPHRSGNFNFIGENSSIIEVVA